MTDDVISYGGDRREVIGIGIPSLGMVSIYFAARLTQLRMPMNTVTRWFFLSGREVGEARNEIVHRARKSGCTALLFLDDDVLFHPDLLLRLWYHLRPIVSGLYYGKPKHRDPEDPFVPMESEPLMFGAPSAGVARGWTHGDLVPVTGHGMGLCLIRSEVFAVIERQQAEWGTPVPSDPNGYPQFFRTVVSERTPDGNIQSNTEDIHFCRLALAAGFDLAVDTSAAAFGWHWDQQKQSAFPVEQWKQFASGQPVTWPGVPAGSW